MFAVIKTGGKQYRVAADQVLQVEKLAGEPGDPVIFGEVLMLGGDEPAIGAPFVAGASVAGEIVEHKRGRKIIIFKKRRRQNSRRKNGHRQEFTLVRIAEILTAGGKPGGQPRKAKKAAPAPEGAAGGGAAGGDDVGRLEGVGPKLKEKLAAAGITSLAQIAALDAAAVDKLDADLDLKGRIGRDDWVGQAKALLAGAASE